MSHSQNHSHSAPTSGSRLSITILLNFTITVAEIICGIISGSLSLISDAKHNFSDGVAEIISSGSSAPAVIPGLCNESFLEKFNSSDMVISKGQGNYEGLSNVNRSMFFLLKAKLHESL